MVPEELSELELWLDSLEELLELELWFDSLEEFFDEGDSDSFEDSLFFSSLE